MIKFLLLNFVATFLPSRNETSFTPLNALCGFAFELNDNFVEISSIGNR